MTEHALSADGSVTDHTAHDDAAAPALTAADLSALRARLMRQARLALRDTAQAEDLVQDTLLAVVQQQDTLRGDAALSTWAIAILKNKIADWYRSPGRARITQLPGDDEHPDDALDALYTARGTYAEPVPAWQRPESKTERQQIMSALEFCLGCLPSQSSRVFMMREWLGFENHEISQRLGVTMDNCRTLLHRARMALRSCMQRKGMGAPQA